MPEAIAILLVFVIAMGIYLFALLQARDPAFDEPEARMKQLIEQRTWLEGRLLVAQRERWSEEMQQTITEQLAELDRAQAELQSSG